MAAAAAAAAEKKKLPEEDEIALVALLIPFDENQRKKHYQVNMSKIYIYLFLVFRDTAEITQYFFSSETRHNQ